MDLSKTRRYKDTYVGKGSQLAAALEEKGNAAKKVYDETTARYQQQYSQEARDYFASHMNQGKDHGT